MPKQNDLPAPVTTNQKFLAKAAGMDVELPTAVTMDQMYLQAIANGGSIEKLKDVAIENPENGEVMKYDAEQGKWINGTASGGGGTSDYIDLTNKPKINNVTLTGNKTTSDLGIMENVQADWDETDRTAPSYIQNKPNIPSGVVVDTTYNATSQNAQAGTAVAQAVSTKVDKVAGKGLSENDYTNADKAKLDGIETGAEANVQADWTQTDTTADDYIKNKPTITDVNDAVLTIQKNGAAVGTFSANAATAATINITVPVDAADVDALPDTTKYGASMVLSIDSSTYVVTAALKDQDGNTLGTAQTIDLPLETVVVGGSYDDTTKKVILTLKNGNTIDFSVADLVAGLQTEITSTNKLDADLVDDATSVHKFVTAADKTAWNAKSDFSGSYNDLTDKPTIPAAQVNADWNAVSGVSQILNKPTIPTPVTVDQTYDAASVNAQAGTAVAQAISTKVDKETGKGLSTNDFTNSDKANLATALEKANAAAPQSTTYTKVETDTLLAGKISHELPVVQGSILEYADSLPAGFYHARQGYGTGSDKPVANEGYVYLIAVFSSSTAQITAFTSVKEGTLAIPNIYTVAKLAGTWGAWYRFEGTAIT